MNDKKLSLADFTNTIPGVPKKIPHLVSIIIALIIIGYFFNINTPTDVHEEYVVSEPTLSPDNKKIILSIRQKGKSSGIGIYDIQSVKFSIMNPTGKPCLSPIYSADGNFIAFVQRDERNTNIVVIDKNFNNIRQITHDTNKKGEIDHSYGELPIYKMNALPSFSPDGQKIIYLQSRVMRKRSMGGNMISHWDIREVNLATGKQRQLTDYRFYGASRPYYLPNGKGFIFSASGAKGDVPEEMRPKNGNEILIMDEKHSYPYRAFEHKTYAVEPSISSKNDIVFVSRTNEYDNTKGTYTYDIFIRRNDNTQRITNERFPATVGLPHISNDGSLVVFLASKTTKEPPDLWLAKTDGTEIKCIGQPWHDNKVD